jgi:hypothetical protein
MSEAAAAQFTAYGNNQSKEAIAARKQLAADFQLELINIIDDICENPKRHPNRIQPISRDGKIVVYKHPDPSLEVTCEIDEEKREIYFMHYAATAVNIRKKVFISYSHEDKEWLDMLRKWLKPLEKNGLLEFWDDTKIKPGSDWRQEIKDAMNSARLAVLLVSQNFLASKFIPEEELTPILQSVENEGVSILWIAVSESTYEETGIEKFQAVNDPKKPLDTLPSQELNKELKEIFKKIKETAIS